VELFRSNDLLVRQVGGHDGRCCVVTFDSFTDLRTLDRPGFGEAFFLHHGIDAVHVLSRENDWYHYPEMAEAMGCVAAAAVGYRRVVTYGSSMGAYAAIRFAGLVGAHAILALSPQYSIDPAVVPWERRWLESGRHFNRRWEQTLDFPAVGEAYVVFDPEQADGRHIARLAENFRFEPIAIPFGGHPISAMLAEVGLLQQLILDICAGQFDLPAFLQRVLERQTLSAHYLINQAARLPARQRPRRLAAIREAWQLAPDNLGVINRLAIEHRFARQFAEALDLHRHALDLAPGHPNMLLEYSITLEKSGDAEAALGVMEELDIRTAGAPIYQPRLRALRQKVARPGITAVLRSRLSGKA
jgi:pimeloyl-ACP methyl ester carboxylesterase